MSCISSCSTRLRTSTGQSARLETLAMPWSCSAGSSFEKKWSTGRQNTGRRAGPGGGGAGGGGLPGGTGELGALGAASWASRTARRLAHDRYSPNSGRVPSTNRIRPAGRTTAEADPPPPLCVALEGKGPRRRPQRRLGRRLEEVAKAVGGGYCRLQMPLRLALAVRGTVAGHWLGALEGGGGRVSPPLPMHPCLA